jgi:hypothetical protein
MLQTLPLIAWGDPDAINAAPYASGSAPVVTGGKPDPFGGTGAYEIDDDAAVNEFRLKGLPATVAALPAWITVFAKQGTSSESTILLIDQTTATSLLRINITWSGGVPSISGLVGSLHQAIAVGNGWYLFVGLSLAVVPANTNQLRLYPTRIGTGTETGSTLFYMRNVVLLDYLSPYHAFERPRPGYARAVAPSLARDSWSYGKEYVRRFRLGWVPDQPRGTPQTLVSGWFGDNESVGVNASIQAMLAAGWDQQPLLFVPDRGACSTYWTGYLERPERDWEPAEEPNQDRAVEIELVGSSPLGGY